MKTAGEIEEEIAKLNDVLLRTDFNSTTGREIRAALQALYWVRAAITVAPSRWFGD